MCHYVPCETVKLFPVTCEYIKGEKQFYYRAQQFYEDVPASEEGMLGDFLEISNVDLEGSRQFLKRFVVSQATLTRTQFQMNDSIPSGTRYGNIWECIHHLHTSEQHIDLHCYSYPWIYMSESILG